MSDRLSPALQENVLAVLCFSEKSAPLIRNAVEPELFSSQLYREIVGRVYDFIDQHKKPPGEHLPDLLEDILNRKDKEAELCLRLVENVLGSQGKTTESYVLSSLEGFIRRQRLVTALIRASQLAQEGNYEEAEVELEKSRRTRLQLFSPGMTLKEGWKKVKSGEVRQDIVRTGVKELDKWGLGPARGELHVLMGPPKRAKSWWLVNLGKHALLARLKVLHITLELSAPQVIQRYIQSFFSLQKHKARVDVSRLETDELGRFVKFERDVVQGRGSILDAKTQREVDKKLDGLRFHDNLIVKAFPTGMLSLAGLRAFLDSLESASSFIPDVLILDYPDLMEIKSAKFKREEIGDIFIGLRGIGVERNIAMPTVTQANRSGADAKLMTDTHASEDFSKIFTADTVLTYSQTLAEKDLGLARLFVSNTRVAEADRFIVLISQAYRIGQFCLDSALMTDSYWGKLKDAAPNSPKEDE